MPSKTAAPETPDVETPEAEEDVPLLELSTLAPERSALTIDGQMYEIRLMAEFGIIEQHKIKGETEEFDNLWKKSKLNKQGEARLKFLLDHLFERVLDAPEDVKAKMNDELRNQVVLAFMLAPLAKAAAAEAKRTAEETEDED